MASAAVQFPADGFTRRLLNEGSELECRCLRCGTVIVGSVLQGLREQEQAHRAECSGHKPPQGVR